jgi:hypothetical protein
VLNNSNKNLQLLQEKLNDFKREYTITADPGRKFQLKQEIEEIEKQIQDYEKPHRKENFSDKNLEFALCKLNHIDQYKKFEKLSNIFDNLVGVRIQTSSKDGFSLVWLLRCLVKSLENEDILCARLSLESHRYRSGNFQLILEGISEGLKLSCSQRSTPEEIIQEICNKMLQEQQHIILLFDGVDSQTKLTLDKILNKFWSPLITKIRKKRRNNNYLLMFWIDRKKSIDWRDVYIFPEKPDDTGLQNYETLFNLCVTSKFKRKELKTWFDGLDAQSAIAKFDDSLVNEENMSHTFNRIWTESQGKPELLLKAIYNLCNLHWENYESRWLDL